MSTNLFSHNLSVMTCCNKQNSKNENENEECVKKTTTRLKNRQKPKLINGSSMQRPLRLRRRALAELKQ